MRFKLFKIAQFILEFFKKILTTSKYSLRIVIFLANNKAIWASQAGCINILAFK